MEDINEDLTEIIEDNISDDNNDTEAIEAPKKVKKPRSEKQILQFKKAQEALKIKRALNKKNKLKPPPPTPPNSDEDDDNKIRVKVVKKKKKKKEIIIEESSSSDDENLIRATYRQYKNKKKLRAKPEPEPESESESEYEQQYYEPQFTMSFV